MQKTLAKYFEICQGKSNTPTAATSCTSSNKVFDRLTFFSVALFSVFNSQHEGHWP